jgi:arsenate reductase-like glutaredoxin family protein
VNTKDQVLSEKDALALAGQVNEIFAAKGKKLVRLNMKRDKPGRATLKALMIGPTGKLRAPTIRVGKKLLVGFHTEAYEEVFS